MLKLNTEIEETLHSYLVNILAIPIMWETRTPKQKDEDRRKLHNKLVKLLAVDREIISKCNEAAYSNFVKRQKLERAEEAFIHEFNVLTGQNPLTQEQEDRIMRVQKQLGNTHEKYDRISKAFFKYCDNVRLPYYKQKIADWQEKLKTKTADELLDMMKKVPERYEQLLEKHGKRSNEWYEWSNTMDYEPGSGFGCIYYRMESYFFVVWFYHDYSKNVGAFERVIKKWEGTSEQINWAIHSLAYIYTKFEGEEEYLATSWEDLLKIFMSFDTGSDDGE